MRRKLIPAESKTRSRQSEEPRLGAVALLEISRAANDHDEHLVSEQLRQLIRTAPILLIAHFIGGVGLLFTMYNSGDYWFTLIGMALVSLTLFFDALFSSIARMKILHNKPPYVGARIATAYGLLVGITWSALLLIGIPSQDFGQQAVIGIAFAGTGTVAALVMAAVPIVLIVHWVILICALAFSFGSSAVALTLSGICFCVAGVAISQARRRLVASRFRHEQDREGRTARMLLAEFEHGGKAWLWETDVEGKLTYISKQLALSLTGEADALLGTPLTDLVIPDRSGEIEFGSGERTLGFHLSTRLPFADLQVRAQTPGAERWWSLSGRPAFDDFQRFIGFRGVGADLTDRNGFDAEISRLARHDALTGLPNRVVMRQTLDQVVRGEHSKPDYCGLFLIDLDRFKNVNDTLGHPVGDALLRQVATRLQREVGDKGRVGRLGGDEFNVVMPGMVDRQSLGDLADRIIAALSQPYMIDGATISIGASIGIAIAPHDGDCADSLVRNADLALYAAKAAGKGVYCFYEKAMQADAKDRRRLEADLRNILRDNGLRLEYQPVVSAKTEQIVGFEALIRWHHPSRGPILPAVFMPLAEEIGLSPAIGEWVIRTACMEAAQWPESIRVAVNLSPLQFANPSLPAVVMSALAAADLAPDRLELEITEGVFLNDSNVTDEMFQRLSGIGVRLALDDFGTGYSSLGYLKKAPFNKIKIDPSFVRGAAVPGNRNAAIIKAIVALAESLEMETTAEGAENHDEVALIRSLGCSHIQGYIFGKPMAAGDTQHLLMRNLEKAEVKPQGVNRAPRTALLRSAVLHVGDQKFNVRVRNVSSNGVMAETPRVVTNESRVEIEFSEGQRFPGEIRWTEQGRIGIKFDGHFALDQLTQSRPAQDTPKMPIPASQPLRSTRRSGSRAR
ncbi:MAG: EAL domain-containing protein [Sphingomonadaceae bacterium]